VGSNPAKRTKIFYLKQIVADFSQIFNGFSVKDF